MVESVSSNPNSASLPSNANDASAGGPQAFVPRWLPRLRVTTEFDSETCLFFNMVSCKLFDSLPKFKLSFHNNNKGHLFDPQLTFTSKHISFLETQVDFSTSICSWFVVAESEESDGWVEEVWWCDGGGRG
nr:outer envelope pore protein 37, chloroplastic [Tanacetum cinerariifolium]